ncbi:Signal recognition particle 9 kDa protein [Glycine soja]|uniref:Signal recognition particle 9 kDa protein n=1 Tax=Glycine soja TaxID=3848 RepID=A0A0B2PPC0_GLYSO|nr:Signal recognition particle 9 kDa protein [Glycine soja]
MVYITEWDKFVEQSIELFRADPDSTRYVMKYRHCDGKLVLKVTDNRQLPWVDYFGLSPQDAALSEQCFKGTPLA